MSPHILLVEDDADSREMLERICEDEGHTVRAVGSVEDAVAALGAETFDVVVTDGFAGFEDGTCEADRVLTAADPTPVIGHTGWPVDPRAAQERGFDSLLRKPARLPDLLDAVARAATRRG